MQVPAWPIGGGRTRMVDTPSRRGARDNAQKRLIARFSGEHIMAERDSETGDLCVFAVSDATGELGALSVVTGDRRQVDSGPRSIAQLNRLNAEIWKDRIFTEAH